MKIKESKIVKEVIYSEDEKHRYSLTKRWNKDQPKVVFIGINPSDTTELIMDKTVINLTNHLVNKGFGEVESLNLFAYRTKKQRLVTDKEAKYEDYNIEYTKTALSTAKLIRVGWRRTADKNRQYQSTIEQIKEELKGYTDKKGNLNRYLSIVYSEEWELGSYTCNKGADD